MDQSEAGGIDGRAIERRRFAPSPPCRPWPEEGAPPGAPLSASLKERNAAPLEAIASAVDRMHGYRLAHGSLSADRVFVDGAAVWFQGVGACWKAEESHRDLDWFASLCESQLGRRTGAPRRLEGTARGILHSWNEAGEPAPAEESRPRGEDREAPAPRPPAVKAKRGGSLGAFVGVVLVAAVALAAQALPAVRAWQRDRWQWFRASVLGAEDLDPRWSTPFQQSNESPLERELSMFSPQGFRDALCSDDPAHLAVFEKMLKAGDSGFSGAMMDVFTRSPRWGSRALPSLRKLLEKPFPPISRRALEFSFLGQATIDDIAAVRKLTGSTSRTTLFNAHEALARLGSPSPIATIERLSEESESQDPVYGRLTSLNYYRLALDFYPYSSAEGFLGRKLFTEDGRPHQVLFELAVPWSTFGSTASEPTREPPDLTLLPMKNRLQLLVGATLRTLKADDAKSDRDLLRELLCIAFLWREPLTTIIERLARQGASLEVLKSRIRRALIDDPLPSDPNSRWRIPDTWHATALGWSSRYPGVYARDVFVVGYQARTYDREVDQQSRLLALANLTAPPLRSALCSDLGKRLDLLRERWQSDQPQLLAAVLAVLAASDDSSAEAPLAEFFSDGPLSRDGLSWDGFVVGAALAPERHEKLLRIAAQHPLPSVWRRANDALAIAAGDPKALRADPPEPPLPDRVADMVQQLQGAQSLADAELILSRQREWRVAEAALARSASLGAREVLGARIDRGESPLASYASLANQPGRLDPRRFDGPLDRWPNYLLVEQPVLLGHALHREKRQWQDLLSIATTPSAGAATPPLMHRLLAVYAVGCIASEADRDLVESILAVVERDASRIVQHAAAVAALRMAKKEDAPLLTKFAAAHPDLDASVARVLKLAAKL